MILIDFEERLVAVNDEANQGVVWEAGIWRPIAPAFARKAWAEGDELKPAAAAKRYPDADQAKIPAFTA